MHHHDDMPIDGVRIVDLFAGPGGLDVAATWLGVSVVGVEWDSDACETRMSAGLETVQDDVRNLGPANFSDATVLAGGPPCQTYTLAGSGSGRRALRTVIGQIKRLCDGDDLSDDLSGLEDERTGLVLEPLRWAIDAHRAGSPYEAIMLEQVPAVLPVWVAVAEALAKIGYKTTTGILQTEQFGVPQTRRRAVLLAALGHQPHLPSPTHRQYRKGALRAEGDRTLLPWNTLGGVIPRPVPFVVVSNYGSGGDPRARGRRDSESPAATVTGKISRNRLLDVNGRELERFSYDEAGRLQSFPRGFPWSGKNVAQQIGNAIPPRLGAHVLAAALGCTVETASLDRAVHSRWTQPPQRLVETGACYSRNESTTSVQGALFPT